MYDEENLERKETLKGIFIKIVLVVLFIFVLMMLFPTKGFVTNYVDEKVKESLIGNDNFNNNLLAMATAGSGYFTSSRLPENTGDKVKMTLGEIYDNKLLVKFSDSNNRTCNNNKSYVEVTKEEEYTMKVNLSCSDKEDYIMLHMGLDGTSFPSTSTARCEFVKNLDDTWAYGKWSSWGTKKISKTSTNQVQTKVSKVQNGTRRVSHSNVITNNAVKINYNGEPKYVCASSYDNAGTYNDMVTCKKTVVTYTDEPVYRNVTYYRSRSKTLNKQVDTKWASCDDTSLIEQGYVKTGNES